MSCHTPLYSWTGQVVSAFPHLSRPQATVLALYSFGAILAQRCGLNSVAATLAALLGLGYLTIRSRLQEFYQPASAKSGTRRRELDVTTCFAPLLAWILKGWPSKRLALALDATSLGDRFTVLSISVVYRGSACPVAWKIVQANVRHAWKPEWITLLRSFQTLVPAGWTVIVMSDRGLYARWLFQEIVALGWHPLMRITHLSKFRQNGSRSSLPVTAFVPKVGQRWQGRGVAFPKTARRRLDCTLLACWEIRSRRTMVRSDRLGAGPERRLVVRDAGLDRTGVQAAQTRRLAMADDPDDRPRPREPIVAGAGRRHPLRAGRRWRSRRGRHRGRDAACATPHLANHARRRANRWPIGSNATTCCMPRSSVARAPEASLGDQTTLGERLSTRIGGVGQHSDRRTCVAKTSMETRAVVGDSSQFKNMP